MDKKIAVAMFGQKRLSREGGAEYDQAVEYKGVRQKTVPTIDAKGARDIIGSTKKTYDN